jgi:hypothetical protein
MSTYIRTVPLEAIVWLTGLMGLAVAGPYLDGHVTVCIPTLMGFDFCPGCGLGMSVSYLFRGDLAASWAAHPLGIPAAGLLAARSAHLLANRNRSIHSSRQGTSHG